MRLYLVAALTLVGALALGASAQIVPQVPASDAIILTLTTGSALVQRLVPLRLQDYVSFGPDFAASFVRYQNALPALAPPGGAELVLVRASDMRRAGSAPLEGRSLALCEYAGGLDVRGRVAVLEYAAGLNASALSDACARSDELGDTQQLVARSLVSAGALAVLTATSSPVGYYERVVTPNYFSVLLVRSYGASEDARSLPFYKLARKDFAALRARLLNSTSVRLLSVGGATSSVSVAINEQFGAAYACQSALACLVQPVLGGVLFVAGLALLALVLMDTRSRTPLQLALASCSTAYGASVAAAGGAACANFSEAALWASTVMSALATALFVASVLCVTRMWTTTVVATWSDTPRRARAEVALFVVLLVVDAALFALLVARSALRSPLAGHVVALVVVAGVSLVLVGAGALFLLRFGREEVGARYARVLRATTWLLVAFSLVAMTSVLLALVAALALTGELSTALVSEQAVCTYATAAAVLQYAAALLLQLFMLVVKVVQRRDAEFATRASTAPSSARATSVKDSPPGARRSETMPARAPSEDSIGALASTVTEMESMQTRASFCEAGLD